MAGMLYGLVPESNRIAPHLVKRIERSGYKVVPVTVATPLGPTAQPVKPSEPRTAAGQWRHATWCRYERGGDTCNCGLHEFRRAAAPDPVASPERAPFVRYHLVKGTTTLTFRVPLGTPMILEQSGWRITSEDGESPVATPAPLDVERLARALGIVFEEKWPKVGRIPDVPVTVFGGYAEDIAAAYALEGQPVAEEPAP